MVFRAKRLNCSDCGFTYIQSLRVVQKLHLEPALGETMMFPYQILLRFIVTEGVDLTLIVLNLEFQI